MYLKKLSIQGFKSFANRTVFEYGSGVTAVVGPNGSGKSNVSDAIRWVLGEQSARLLRAKKQEDVIFSGTKDRAAVGMAEVILTLDNSDKWLPVDFAEVEVGRRVYRNGDTEYLLNGSRVRLRDVVDLLMKGDVGQNSYTIMGQGLVDEVLSMTPDERRYFLDEAADVKRFRIKIKEAQDRLTATRDNLERVGLVITEIEPRLAQLSRQADRAAEHQRLSGELAELLRTYYGHRWSEAHNHLVRARAGLDQRTAEVASASERVEQYREQLRALSEEIRKRREAITRRDASFTDIEQRMSLAEQAIALDRERHAMVSGRREEVRLEIEALEGEKISLSSADVDEGRRALEIAEDAEQAKTMVQQCREALELAEREYAAVRSHVQELKDGAEADTRRSKHSERDAEAARGRLVQLDQETQQAEARRVQLIAELKAFGARFAELREQVRTLELDLDHSMRDAEDARARLGRVQDEVRAYEADGNQDLRELDHLEGRLEALKRVQAEHDGVAAGTRAALIMGQALIEGIEPGSLGEPPEVPGILGLLARQIRVQPGMETAINAALEHRLHAVVVESDTAAFKAIELLNQRREGRAQFVTIEASRHNYPLNLQKERGVVGVAAKLVKCDKRFQPLIDTLLGRVIVVEDLQAAQRMLRRSLGAVVTLDGTVVDQSGVITGGTSGSEEGVFSRQRELDELPERIEELRGRVAVSQQQLERAREAIDRLAGQAKEADQAYEGLRRDVERARYQLERERDRLHKLRREVDGVDSRMANIDRERAAKEQLIAQASEAAREAAQRSAERTQQLAGLEQELADATAKRDTALKAVSDASARLASVEGERKALQAMREQHEKAIERIQSQIAAKKLQARNLELEASVIDERLGKHARELEAIRLEQARYADDAAPDRDELHRLETHERSVQEEFNNAQSELLRIDRQRLDLEAEVARATDHIESLRVEMEREGLAPDRSGKIVSLDDAMTMDSLFEDTPAPTIQGGALIDVDDTKARIEEIRRKIRRLGPINAEAPEDYRESKERYEFLTTQMRDLTEAEEQLREAIGQLNEEIRTRFGATFEKVNSAFGEYFTAFFGGGSAQLILTNPENIAEAGIEMEAQPPGKRVRTLSLLSGGERSLTAVALLFALLTANPAPFCVLDEVDAALDEANVGRFTSALKQLAERTQFLMVTHNRRTVEVADAIYGVSMGKDGVSKVLSLKLSDVPEE
ncbi:MAG: chromosome segregation protein SMC [Dehalococcoidia bacterium]|nr:chromosome segregation protein SMC [Dehalococcoidia bacterium]